MPVYANTFTRVSAHYDKYYCSNPFHNKPHALAFTHPPLSLCFLAFAAVRYCCWRNVMPVLGQICGSLPNIQRILEHATLHAPKHFMLPTRKIDNQSIERTRPWWKWEDEMVATVIKYVYWGFSFNCIWRPSHFYHNYCTCRKTGWHCLIQHKAACLVVLCDVSLKSSLYV